MYNGLFNWWVQSVMPVVFDDSLSYYEVLAKLTKYIEGLTGDVAQIEKILGTIEGIEDVTQFTQFLESIQTEIGLLDNLSTSDKTSLVNAINEVAQKANQAYVKPANGIPEKDLDEVVKNKLNRTGETTDYIVNNRTLKKAPSNNSPAELGLGTYSVPDGGIPWDTLSEDVHNRIEAGGSGTGGTKDYTDLNNKPGINGHTLNAGNNSIESLGLGTYNKPVTGIPEGDLSEEIQEKLNTSGGIAGSENSFVATKDYEIGELVYINGTLYKAKYNILSGTNLIPGNNIEETDINSEIESINNKIDQMASGEGLDSWSLVYNITIASTDNTYHDFFEYVALTGGESYLFIITPTIQGLTYDRGYIIECRKRDGTIVETVTVSNRVDYENQYRFAFTPVETGEYYFTVKLYSGGGTNSGAKLKIELEYTQSQGMTELWNQVNAASSLEPRVGALEGLVEQQQTQLEGLVGLEDIPQRVDTLEQDVTTINDDLKYKANLDAYLSNMKSGSIVIFDDSAIETPLAINADIGVKQEGSGTPSFSNVRTIVPHNEITIYKSGEDTSNPIIYSVPLDGVTLYGFSYNNLTGKIIVKWAKYRIETVASVGSSGGKYFTRNTFRSETPSGKNTSGNPGSIVSDSLVENENIIEGSCRLVSNGRVIQMCLPDQTLTTTAAVNEFLAEHPVEFCYELAEPFELENFSNPITVKSNAGYNAVWVENGKIENLTYYINANAAERNRNPWLGLDGVAFGTSLTYRASPSQTGGYLRVLPSISGIDFENQGLGGSMIVPTENQPEMLSKITGYSDYENKQVVILEGFVNDWAKEAPLGAYTDLYDPTNDSGKTACGCVRYAINYIFAQNSNLTLFLVLDHYGKSGGSSNCSSTAKNGDHITQYEYYEEIAKVGESMGVHVIKLYAESEICERTPQYIRDNIHPTEPLGTTQTANTIWACMRKWYPNFN